MKLTLTILFICCSLLSRAANYYVSNVGSDSNTGTMGNPFATISKANSVAVSGDFIFLKRGDSWHEKVYPVSGVTYDAYGTGDNPIITGFETLTSWTNEGGNIWSTTFSNCPSYLKVVYLNGDLREKGRYPNNDYLRYSSHSGSNQITGDLTGDTSYVGAECSVRSQDWGIDKQYITAQSGGTLTLAANLTYAPHNGYGYIIFNKLNVLDIANEWCIDTTTKKVYVYSTSTPTGKASSIDTLIDFKNRSNVTFTNIQIEGANRVGLFVDSSNNITISNCIIKYIGGDGIRGGYGQRYLTVRNNSIYECWSGGIFLNDFGLSNDNTIVTGNLVRDIGLSPVMSNNGNWTSTGIQIHGSENEVSYNQIINVGYSGVFANGYSNNIHHNLIDTFATVNGDAGGIYMNGMTSTSRQTGNRISNNIILHGLGTLGGTTSNNWFTFGIYFDDYSYGVIADNNTVAYCAGSGIMIHDTYGDTVINNTLAYNGSVSGTSQLRYTNLKTGLVNDSILVTNNILYSHSNQYVVDMASLGVRLSFLGVSDSNYYSKPANESQIFKYGGSYFSLTQMQDSGQDINSKGTPDSITLAKPLLFYNTGLEDKLINLDGNYTDMKGNIYSNSVFIKPYQSLLLFKSTKIIPPKTHKISSVFTKLKQE